MLISITALACVGMAASGQPVSPLAGRWQYLQPPDKDGEVLDISYSDGRYRAIMNGLERAGEHGLFYYVVEASGLAIGAGSTISFTVGERSFVSRRPPLSKLGGEGTRGVARDRMYFRGGIEGRDLVLKCEGAGNPCPASTLRFKRLLEK